MSSVQKAENDSESKGSSDRVRVFGILGAAILVAGALGAAALLQPVSGDPLKPVARSLWDDWRARFTSPQERNAFLRVPAIDSDFIGAAISRDGQHVWAAGTDGQILVSEDSGVSWQVHQHGVSGELTRVYMADDGQHGWIAGEDGLVAVTVDGGRTWRRQQVADERTDLYTPLFLRDLKKGWIAGSDGTIVMTEDGGKRWRAQKVDPDEDLYAIAFSDDGVEGYAVGDEGTILHTGDGGRSWQRQESGTKVLLFGVALSTRGNHAVAVGEKGTVLVQSEKGAPWRPVRVEASGDLANVTMAPDGRGWVVGEHGTLLETADGGTTWSRRWLDTRGLLTSIALSSDGKRAVLVGGMGYVATSTNAGSSWVRSLAGGRLSLRAVALANDGLRGWAVGGDGALFETSDGGFTWRVRDSGTRARLSAVFASADGKRIWLAGREGTIIASRDGGETWLPQRTGSGATFTAIGFAPDGLHGWAAAVFDSHMFTTDGGVTWRSAVGPEPGPQMSQTSVPTSRPVGAGESRVWVATGYGLMATTDRGASWTSSRLAPPNVGAVAFTSDGQGGWAISTRAISVTSDGGSTWTAAPVTTDDRLTDVAMSADGHSWALARDGALIEASKPGASWQRRTLKEAGALQGIAISPDGKRGVIVGSGTIFATDDAGRTWTKIAPERSPALWFYATLAATFAAALVALIRTRKAETVSLIDASGQSDEPIATPAEDRIGHAEFALGLSRYLRNRATRPPLVLSINAPWGRGKSSVMRMLEGELRAHGLRPVWFNAWHHQNEPMLLASLLDAIGAQAIPTLLSWAGIRFRARLIKRRITRSRTLSLLLGLFALTSGAYLWDLLGGVARAVGAFIAQPEEAIIAFEKSWDGVMNHDLLQVLLEDGFSLFLGRLLSALFSSPERILTIGAFVALLVAVLSLLSALRAFPSHPSVLLAGIHERFKPSEAQALTAFRERFQRHFGEVCEALEPGSLTLFIDDLDRCSPDVCAQMLESINYLTSSGRCFVVLGLAREMVEAQLALHYEKIANSLARSQQLEGATNAGGESSTPETLYVRNYLRKLINLDLKLPVFDSADAAAMLVQADEGDVDRSGEHAPSHDQQVLAGYERLTARVRPVWSVTKWVGLVALLAVVVCGVGRSMYSVNEKLADLRKEHNDVCRQKLSALEASSASLTARVESAAEALKEKADDLDARVNVKQAQDSLAKYQSALLRARAAFATGNLGAFDTVAVEADAAALSINGSLPSRKAEGGKVHEGAADAPPPEPAEYSDSGPARLASNKTVQSVGVMFSLVLAAVVMFLSAAFRLARLPVEIIDSPKFLEALTYWSPVLTADNSLAAPREVKRFANRARYFAMRLRESSPKFPWLLRLLTGVPETRERSKLAEPHIVALTAIHHVNPRSLYLMWSWYFRRDESSALPRASGDHLLSQLSTRLIEHGHIFGDITREDFAHFIAVVSEFADDGGAANPGDGSASASAAQ